MLEFPLKSEENLSTKRAATFSGSHWKSHKSLKGNSSPFTIKKKKNKRNINSQKQTKTNFINIFLSAAAWCVRENVLICLTLNRYFSFLECCGWGNFKLRKDDFSLTHCCHRTSDYERQGEVPARVSTKEEKKKVSPPPTLTFKWNN